MTERSDLVAEHFDVAIRINPPMDDGLVGRCFAKDRLVLVASTAIAIPKQNRAHASPIAAVVMPTYREGEIWTVRDKPLNLAPQPVMRLSSLLTVRDAVVAGAGAALLPQSIVAQDLVAGKLVCWGISGADTELWVLHTSRRLSSPKVKAFVEFLCDYYRTGWFAMDA